MASAAGASALAAFSRIALIISAGDLPAATGAAVFGASAAAATGAAAGAAPAGAAPLARIAAMMSAVPFGLPAGGATAGAAEAAAGAAAGAAGAAAFARMAAMMSAVPLGFSPAGAATGAGAAGGVASAAAGAVASGAGAGVGAAAPSAGFLRSIAMISAVVGFLSVMVIGRGEAPRFIRDKRTEPRTELSESVGIVGIMASHYGCDNQSLTTESRFSVSGR